MEYIGVVVYDVPPRLDSEFRGYGFNVQYDSSNEAIEDVPTNNDIEEETTEEAADETAADSVEETVEETANG